MSFRGLLSCALVFTASACAFRPNIDDASSASGAPAASTEPAAPEGPPLATVAKIVPEGCEVIAAVAGSIEVDSDTLSEEQRAALEESLARAAGAIEGNLVVPHGLGIAWDKVTRYGHAFRCTQAALASLSALPRCQEGPFELPPTAQELRWGTAAPIVRGRSCALQRIYKVGMPMPQLGVHERFQYPSEDCEVDFKAWKSGRSSSDPTCLARIRKLKAERSSKNARAAEHAARNPPQAAPARKKNVPPAGSPEWWNNQAIQMQARELLAFLPQPSFAKPKADAAAYALLADAAAQRKTEAAARKRLEARETLEQAYGASAFTLLGKLADHAERRYSTGHPEEALLTLELAVELIERAEPVVGSPWKPDRWIPALQMQRAVWLLEQGELEASRALLANKDSRALNPLETTQERIRTTGTHEDTWKVFALELEALQDLTRNEADAHARAAEQARSGRAAEAIQTLAEAAAIHERQLDRFAALAASPSAFLPWLERSSTLQDMALTLAMAMNDSASASTAFWIASTRKDRASSATGLVAARRIADDDRVGSGRGTGFSEPGFARLARVRAMRSRAAARFLSGQELQPRDRREIAQIEVTLLRDTFKSPRDPLTRAAATARATDFAAEIASVLQAGEVLIEIVGYQPLDFAAAPKPRAGGRRYAAFIVRSGAASPRLIDLGPSEQLETIARELRELLSSPHSAMADVTGAAQQAYDVLWRPLEPALADSAHIFVASDGELILLPFEALHDGSRWLLERASLSYLNNARELPELRSPASAAAVAINPPIVLADAAQPEATYDDPALAPAGFRALPFARDEASAIKSAFPDVSVLAGGIADEPMLLNAHRPSFVHIATHGIVLGRTARAGTGTRASELVVSRAAQAKPAGFGEEDWMRAAIVLSPPSIQDSENSFDSYATAFEIARANLVGTQLVMLTACNSAIGTVHAQHGVRSLRRAFMIAGAQSVIASLWPVPDSKSTADLVGAFYGSLKAGASRASALLDAKRATLRAKPHPYYWAALTLTGDVSPIRP